MKLFSVYDLKAEVYAPPFLAHNEEVARRMIAEACEDTRISLAKYPADYQLRMVGEWSEDDGLLGSHERCYPRVIASVEEILKVVRSVPSEEPDNGDHV